MEPSSETEHAKSGPANPADGIDQPTPPGGPQRVDQPATDPTPRDAVEENAATSLDQPSDGSGGE